MVNSRHIKTKQRIGLNGGQKSTPILTPAGFGEFASWSFLAVALALAPPALAFPPNGVTEWGEAVPFGDGWVASFYSHHQDTSLVNPMFPPAPAPMPCEQVALVAMDVPPDQQAPGHINVGAVEPGMGNHLIDITSHEFSGDPFTYTFIYGSNLGELIFMEPMITVDWLRQLNGHLCVDISMPQAFPEAGPYPTQYCMQYRPEADAYIIYYRAFQHFPASAGH